MSESEHNSQHPEIEAHPGVVPVSAGADSAQVLTGLRSVFPGSDGFGLRTQIRNALFVEIAQPVPDLQRTAELLCLSGDTLGQWCHRQRIPYQFEAVLNALRQMEDLPRRLAVVRLLKGTAGHENTDSSAERQVDRTLRDLVAAEAAGLLAGYLERDDAPTIRGTVLVALTEPSQPAIADRLRDATTIAQDVAEFSGAEPALLVDAEMPVRIGAVVRALADELADQLGTLEADDEQGYSVGSDLEQLAANLLDIPRARLQSIRTQAIERVSALLADLPSVGVDRSEVLDEKVSERYSTLALQVMALPLDRDVQAFRAAGVQALRQTLDLVCLEFVLDQENSCLRGSGDIAHGFEVSFGGHRNLVSEALRQRRPLRLRDEIQPLTVLDRQLQRRLARGLNNSDEPSGPDLLYVPFFADDTPLGVLVFPLNHTDAGDDTQCNITRLCCTWYSAIYGQWFAQLERRQQERSRIESAYIQANEKRLREVVHEANNPLSIVHNYLFVLGQRLKDEDGGKEQLRVIGEEIRRTGEIIQGLLKLPAEVSEVVESAQAQADSEQGELTDDLGATVRDVAELMRSSLDEQKVVLTLQIDRGPHPSDVVADKVKQVLTNLMKNAAEAMTEGGSLQIALRSGLFRNGQPCAEIEIRDSGPGLDERVLAQLAAPKVSHKGGDHAGIGLHLVHRLVQEMRGTIDCRSRANEGTTFTVVLPLRKQDQ